MEIKITLKAARVNAGLTIKEAAKALEVTAATLVNWEQGKTHPTMAKAVKISEVYNFPLDNIFFQ